jgi:uncharacterized sulfatase
MQMSGYKKSAYPTYALYQLLHSNGKLKAPFDQFMAASKPGIEFFDLKSDPNELNNLAADPHHATIRQSLFQTLVKELKEFEKNMVVEKETTKQQARESAACNYKSGMSILGLDIHASDQEIVSYWSSVLLKGSR